ncbi:8902_t:CDS:2 [Acaulospora morrowiae]|uniref:8902_t:CDS:1 n=1 Tax=Acaulospora morrowiae TaxID=94023 RepID=A0A9N9GPB5_9GLOM|nr:8902_t:CDS:2 [Acaulospora morrowiae]
MSTLLAGRIQATYKTLHLNCDKPPCIFRNVIKPLFLCRYAKKRKTAVKLLMDFETLGKKDDIVLVKPGYMRHRLYPQRIADYYIHKGRKEIQEGQKQIHLLSKGGQLTLAIYGTGYSSVIRGVPSSIAKDDQYVTQYFGEIQRKMATLNHINRLVFKQKPIENADNDSSEIQEPVTVEHVYRKIRYEHGITFNTDDMELQGDGTSGQIQQPGEYNCNFCFREIEIKVPVKIVVEKDV